MFNNGWLPASQITQCSVANPGIFEFQTGRFGATELTEGVLNMALIVPGGRRNSVSVNYPPASAFEHKPLLVLRWQIESQLQRLVCMTWQGQEREGAPPVFVQGCVFIVFLTTLP